MERTTLAPWREFRKSDDSRYIALTLPHVLLRVPYGKKTAPVEGFNYEEKVAEHADYLWGNAAYPLAQRINNAFSLYHWCAAIRGVEGGGLVEGLPFYTFKSAGEDVIKCPTEVAITDRRENELSDQGLLALCYKKNSNQAAFFGGSTANKPTSYNLASANANARLSAQLPYILATSRFAHYIKVMMRDKVGSFASRENVANYLNNWIADYILLNDSAGQETKARLPLREARVDVTEVPGKPGAYRAIVFLRPHFQLNELTVSMRLVAELPPPAA
jgi:type VI secretion system protein ImpC